MFRRLTDDFHVAPQIELADLATAAAQGFLIVINNRPDGEEPDAPQGDAVAAAAAAAGLAYAAIPVGHGGFSAAQLDALDATRAAHPGKALAYCRSGTRSTHLWALAQARGGADVDGLCGAAAAAGYDISMLRPIMTSLSAGV
ncbi:MAG: TIGR01244 family sulfur transferase [Sphingopyxis sp.]|nr:TIGR01244 family sulfur transferase [Sphingopyxis sp.]